MVSIIFSVLFENFNKLYAGENEIVETIYEIRKIKCNQDFIVSVKAVKALDQK